MKQLWLSVSAVVLLLAAAFWWNQQQQAQLELLRQQTDAMRIEANKIAENAAQLNAESKALQLQVERDRALVEQQRERYINASHIADGLNVASRIKVMIVEYYLSEGVWPASNKALGMPAPDAYASTSLKSMAVAEKGKIVLTYNEASGLDGGQIQLIPNYDVHKQEVTWLCQSADFVDISNIAPHCVHSTAANDESQQL